MENEQSPKTKNINSKPAKLYSFSIKQILISGLVVIVIICVTWIWKTIQMKSLKNEYAAHERELILKTAIQLEETNKHFLRLIAKPYVWAVRTELMQGNISQVNLYGNDIVREKNFISVMVADPKGAIISSTDKKYEGKDLLSVRSSVNLNADSTVVRMVSDSVFMMSSPIMSFNSKLGTLIIDYAAKNPRLLPGN